MSNVYSETQKGYIYKWRVNHREHYLALQAKYSKKNRAFRTAWKELLRLGDIYLI